MDSYKSITKVNMNTFKENFNKIRMWLDDVRPMPREYNYHAKTSIEAINMLKNGNVVFISFDHDLGEDDTGYKVAQWIEEAAYNNKIKPIDWQIHSANPIGAKRIESTMKNAERFWNESI